MPICKRNIFLVLSTAVIFAAAFWARADLNFAGQNQVFSSAEAQSSAEPTLEPDLNLYPAGRINVLLLGLDRHGLSDVIMVASFDQKTRQALLLSIPRDTHVADQTWAPKDSGLSHLCFAHYFGMGPDKDYSRGAEVTARWIEHLLGLPIHEYASIDHNGFVGLIDLLGGVEIYVDPAFEGIKPHYDGDVYNPLPTGLQRLSGEQAFLYSHYRGVGINPRIPEPGSDSEDGDRIRRNQRLFEAVIKQTRTLNLSELTALIRQLPKSIHTSLGLFDLIKMAPTLYKVDITDLLTVVLPGEFTEVYEEESEEYTYYFYLDHDSADQILFYLGLK